MTLNDALTAIRNSGDMFTASAIRNEVAMEAMCGQRPESDADACRAAYFERWADEIKQQPEAPRPRLYFTGD